MIEVCVVLLKTQGLLNDMFLHPIAFLYVETKYSGTMAIISSLNDLFSAVGGSSLLQKTIQQQP